MIPIEKTYIIANWKTNPETYDDALRMASEYMPIKNKKSVELVICPPPIFQTIDLPKNIMRGAQNVYSEKNATGGWSVNQLISLGVAYCIVGHSERRALGDSDQDIQKKIVSLLESNITPIVCVGELERDSEMNYIQILIEQIHGTFSGITRAQLEKIIIAYEPVWAIGAGATPCDPDQCREIILLIKRELIRLTGNGPVGKITVVYGGSVNATNAQSYIVDGDAEGLLIGRASLDTASMRDIVDSIQA
jgi:triosephosphate isomerase